MCMNSDTPPHLLPLWAPVQGCQTAGHALQWQKQAHQRTTSVTLASYAPYWNQLFLSPGQRHGEDNYHLMNSWCLKTLCNWVCTTLQGKKIGAWNVIDDTNVKSTPSLPMNALHGLKRPSLFVPTRISPLFALPFPDSPGAPSSPTSSIHAKLPSTGEGIF